MKIILGDNPFFGVHHSKVGPSDLKSKHEEFAATIDYACKHLGISEMMISPHEQYIPLLRRVESSLALTVLIPMPQELNKKVAASGINSLVKHYLRLFSTAILSPKFIVAMLSNIFRLKGIRFHLFFILFYLEAKKVVSDVSKTKSVVLNFGMHNLMTDILLASGNVEAIEAFSEVCSKLETGTVIVTQNLPTLLSELKTLRSNKAFNVCGSVNQLSYMTNPSLEEVIAAAESRPENIRLWAMQILGSGAIGTEALNTNLFKNFDAVLIASRKPERLKELHDALTS